MKSFFYTSENDLQSSISELVVIQNRWSSITFEERVHAVSQIAQSLLDNKNRLALLAAEEMGKPIKMGEQEIEKSVRALREIPGLWKEPTAPLMAQAYGLIFSLQPWNFPFWQVFRMCATAWATGNVILLKHSDLVFKTAKEIEKICIWKNQSLLKNVSLENNRIHDLIEKDPRVRFVTFTGSTEVGKKIAETCGRAMKPGVFELGGNDAYLVLEDADVNLAAEKCAFARLINSGQSCVSGKRFFIHKNIKNQFLDEFKKHLLKAKWGSPLDKNSDYGPLAHEKFKNKLNEQIKNAQTLGAKWVEVLKESHGFPQVGFLDFGQNWTHFESEEIFAPVALIYDFENWQEVVSVINAGPYGLAGGVFTKQKSLALQIAQMIQVGTFAWNDFSQSDPQWPFGGCKDSGFGREMGNKGLEQFVYWKVLRGF